MKRVIFTVSNAVANNGGAMEADTIKNGASSKSQMSRRNNIITIV